jgi:hypothetical protein
MSTNVTGFKPPDKKWKDMKAIWEACEDIDIEIPKEVLEFFNHTEPDEKGVEIEIQSEEWGDECSNGIEIEVSKIPNDVKIIRFYNSW